MKTLSVIQALGISLLPSTALHAEGVMIVYDASGSMWGQIDGVTKIEIAREVMGDLLTTWPEGANLGLVAYGHRQEGTCSDIETVVPVGPVDRSAFLDVVNGINPLGRTPLSWSEPVHPQDWVTIVPVGSDEGAYAAFHRVGSNSGREIVAPAEPGLYELRYVLNEGGVTLGRHIVEVVEATASLDDGASLSVPETAAPGETVIVTWIGGSDGADQRIALAREDQALFAWISAQPIDPEGALSFTLPDNPGRYEFRFLDISGQSVLGRAIIDVE